MLLSYDQTLRSQTSRLSESRNLRLRMDGRNGCRSNAARGLQALFLFLFLDEIDSLSLTSQAALLRLLQESEYRPVGSEKTYHCNVRLIASANCDLQEKIEAGLFRRDLFYRLHILTVHMPALRDRKDDIPVLVRHFLRQFSEQYELGEKVAPAELMNHLA